MAIPVSAFYLDVKRTDEKNLCGYTIVVWKAYERSCGKKNRAIDLFLVLQRTYRSTLARVEDSKKRAGLGDSDFRVLEALLRRGPLPVNLIGELIDLTTGSITTAVDRMEARWLVVRKNHPSDRRIRLVDLTSKGRKLIERGSAQFAIDMDDAFSCLSQEERFTLAGLLGKLSAHTERESN
jgi:MarR family 2-MHQ and catechol resistance regulon transcriptional repressor